VAYVMVDGAAIEVLEGALEIDAVVARQYTRGYYFWPEPRPGNGTPRVFWVHLHRRNEDRNQPFATVHEEPCSGEWAGRGLHKPGHIHAASAWNDGTDEHAAWTSRLGDHVRNEDWPLPTRSALTDGSGNVTCFQITRRG
jgi:hypothetical protein